MDPRDLPELERTHRGLQMVWQPWMQWFTAFLTVNIVVLSWRFAGARPLDPAEFRLLAWLFVTFNAQGTGIAIGVAIHTWWTGARARALIGSNGTRFGFPTALATIAALSNALALGQIGGVWMWLAMRD